MIRLLFGVLSLVVLLTGAHAQTGETMGVTYTVILDRPQTQTVRVVMEIPGVEADEISVHLPAWRPGRYVILDPASEVRRFSATDAAGSALASAKSDKATWVIEAGGTAGEPVDVRVEYEIYANELSLRTRHVDATHAFLDGSTVFMLYPPLRDLPARVRIEAPADWHVSTGLASEDGHTFSAPDYDILVDSPFEIGTHTVLKFQVDGVPHEIAIWGDGDWDAERLRRDFADIVREQKSIFGALPYERYVFQLHVQPGIGGGTEHYNSTIMQTRPTAFDSPESYRGLLGLVSHEFFHTWNVKRFRPAGISRYDYTSENYTRSLWLAEGTTSYYDDLTLARVGLVDLDEYMKRLGGTIEGLRSRPGERVQSLEDSSFDAWIKFNRPGPDRDNTTVSFYSKGALASLVLDMQIRSHTGNARSLDDVMKALYAQFPLGGPGYTPEDVVAIASRIAGTDLSSVFASYISGTEPLPLEESLATVGLELYEKQTKNGWEKDGERTPREQRGYLGINVTGGSGGAKVRSVLEDGPAFEGGIVADDEIVAINGRRVDSGSFSQIERQLEPGEKASITLFRRDRLVSVDLVAGGRRNATWSVRLVRSPTGEQVRAFEAWMDLPWPSDDAEDKSDTDGGKEG